MLPKRLKLSLRKETDFFKKAKKIYTSFFSIYYQANSEELKLSVIVPKKVIKKATIRNKTKRLFYDLLVKNKNTLPKLKLVLIINKDVKQSSKIELEKELNNQITRITQKT